MQKEFDAFTSALTEARGKVLHAENAVTQVKENIQTKADLIAEASMIESLKRAGISCSLYSEELPSPLQLGDGKYDIVLDPIDGSFAFLHGITAFASIAMIVLENKQVKYSFVQSISDDDLYHCDQSAAYLNGAKIVCDITSAREPYFVTGFAGNKQTALFSAKLAKIPSKYYFFNEGGPKFSALVSANKADVAIEFMPTKFQEFAGAFIAQKAGAFVETLEGGPVKIDPFLYQTLITSRSERLLREIQEAMVSAI